ncbi:PEP-CTERM sorting domain-containing protein [Pelomonas sp. SE-A7]|uniref:PEP-CTERM sorting domain-containing protein n=1 Tax=Pelomonas sp. SE-A7 TaxID=3054953 RepID=UPI00259C9A7B|nr:PEP-CTERM sorting domain-containing protein [Pelomonas sp. SE-A7]MDM4765142.1 PEP-CTERM sorting domain-containing protein [Pelomonas sp. SE-A7]
MKKIKTLAAALSLAAAAFAPSAQASTLPSGVQNDVSAATVASWGYTQCYSSTYGATGTAISSVLAGCTGDVLMMAARRVGSDMFEVLAAANYADVIFDTGTGNTTHSANNVEWYFNSSYSWGFAGAGDIVSRTSCDTAESEWTGGNDRDRLCWHTGGGAMNGGWRAGNFIGLNDSSDWEKVLLVADAPGGEVPEPLTLSLVGLGLAGIAASRRRKAA